MPDFRSFSDTPPPGSEFLALSAEESLHLIAVNRARVGDPVVAFDGSGREWRTEVDTANRRGAMLRVIAQIDRPPLPYRLAIAQSIPKAKGLEAIVRKCAEIGVQDVYPLVTERSEFKLKPGKAASKDARWRQAGIEGCKQSGNPFVPAVHEPMALDGFLAGPANNFDARLCAALTPEAKPIGSVFRPKAEDAARPRSAVWLIGPEGDLSPAEYAAAFAAGFLPVTLGPYVMKCETAAVAALSLLRAELE